MKKSLVAALVVAGITGLWAGPSAFAQRAAAPRSGTGLVDMGLIMKSSNKFNAAMEKLKAQYEAKGEELKKDGERGNQLTEELRALPANSPQRKAMEQEILKLRADYEIKGKRITEDIRDSESKIVLGLSSEVRNELERYGKATGTQLILRANPEPPNLTDPRIILQEIHKPIVYQANSDVTAAILDSLNRGTVPSTAAAPVGAPAARGAALPQRPATR
jgi:Skp family chaperone for outer membrane proteins